VMSEVPLYMLIRASLALLHAAVNCRVAAAHVQGYLAHKKPHHPRTLNWAYAQGPMVVLGGGGLVLMSEVTL